MDRIQNCQEKFEALFGGKPTQNEGNDPEFMRILQRFIFGEVSYTGSLDDKMRELITITVLTVNQTLPQLKAHVGACLHIGISPVAIREAVYECAPFIGFPKRSTPSPRWTKCLRQTALPFPSKAARR